MKFRTEYTAGKSELRLSPKDPVILTGSCFADNMVAKMNSCLWKTFNPFGTLYNPLSIEKALGLSLLTENPVEEYEKSLFYADGLWRSWWFDSKLAAENKTDSIEAFAKRIETLKRILNEGKTLTVTFGTSWCYYLKNREDYPVGNCHKQPQSIFERRRLDIVTVSQKWNNLINDLKERFPGLRILFTVSPVRHLKDSFEGNSLSKAILLLAIEQICRMNSDCFYFPTYEIVNDDLRDYRFYASDLLHPSEEAIGYLWEKFCESFVDDTDKPLLTEGEKIYKAWNHIPLPTSSNIPEKEFNERENKRRREIKERYEALRKINPSLSPLN